MDFVWFCASGDSFFLGAALMLLAVAVSAMRQRRGTTLLIVMLSILALTLIALAAMPFPPAFYAVLGAVTAFLVLSRGPWKWTASLRRIGQTGVLILCALGMVSEGKSRVGMDLPPGIPIYVIGDSVSAGIQGPNEPTWPRLLAKEYAIDVINLAESGATVASAIKQAQRIGDGPGLVLLEIGGNDLFAPTPPAQFREDLDRLLEQITQPNRRVAMLELPILPWQIQYGRIQRQAAESHGVILVPKRVFVKVLRHKGATLDLAHLSAVGHRKMATEVAALLGLNKNPS